MTNENIFEDMEEFYSPLCDRAKGILMNVGLVKILGIEYIKTWELPDWSKLTPIEQIFGVEYMRMVHLMRVGDAMIDSNLRDKYRSFNDALWECFGWQTKVESKDKNFIIDFTLDPIGYHDDYPTKYAIEIDGYDYHSSKQQMNHDYERENELKKLGYSVVRFTGSQVYNSPTRCVLDFIEIILNDLRRVNK